MIKIPKPTKRRRKPQADPTFRPRKRTRSNGPLKNSNILSLLNAAMSPAPLTVLSNKSPNRIAKAVLESEHIFPEDVTLQTPQKGSKTSCVTTKTPRHRKLTCKRQIQVEEARGENTISIYMPETKVTNLAEDVPDEPPKSLSDVTLNPIEPIEDALPEYVPITLKALNQIARERQKRLDAGQSDRVESQNQTMGMTADNAAKAAGFPVSASKKWNWCHLLAYALVGKKGQIVSNLVLGTQEANAEMTLVEPIIRKILEARKKQNPQNKKKEDILYLKVVPTFVKGFEQVRLIKNLTFIIQNKPGKDFTQKVTFHFNMLSRNKTSVSEIPLIEKLLVSLFEEKKSLLTEKDVSALPPPSPSLTPTFQHQRGLKHKKIPHKTPDAENRHPNKQTRRALFTF